MKIKLYVTNILARWNSEKKKQEIRIYGRTKDLDRRVVTVLGFSPYFFARSVEVAENYSTLLSNESVVSIEPTGYESIFGDELGRVEVRSGNDVKELSELFTETFESDVYFTDRAMIDLGIKTGIEIDVGSDPDAREFEIEYDDIRPIDFISTPRVVTFDIETDDRGAFPELGERRILSIVAHDSYSDETHGFIDLDGRPVESVFPDGKPRGVDALHFDSTERTMLIRFASWFSAIEPDYLMGFNSDSFDLPYLLTRMDVVEANPDRLSPERFTKVSNYGRATLSGVISFDLLSAYKSTKRGELDSYKLDSIATAELGEQKVDHTGESIYDMWQHDADKLIRYNAVDVRLTVDVNSVAGVLDFKQALRHEVGVTLDNTSANNQYIAMMARRKLYEIGKIAPDAKYVPKDEKYTGAHVFDAYTGIAVNVVGMDLSSLYPYTMRMLNAGPETKLQQTVDRQNVAIAPNGAAFDLTTDGIFKLLIDDSIGLKSDYKELRDSHIAGTPEYTEYSEKYDVSKTITNSVYGVSGWERFFLYDEDAAEAVTTMGQAVIKATQKYINSETVGTVIYGDTDSNYVMFPSDWDKDRCLQEAFKIAGELNENVYPKLAVNHGMPAESSLWNIEVESYMKRFFQAGKKKRYAYLCTWKDGNDCEPKLSISGFDTERSSTPTFTKELQRDVLEAILHGVDTNEIGTMVYEKARQIARVPDDVDAIGIPGGLSKDLDKYAWTNGRPKSAHPRGAFFSNQLFGTNFQANTKPKRIYIEPFTPDVDDWPYGQIDVIAFEDAGTLPDDLRIDVLKMTETLVVNPMRKILDSIDVDIDAAIRGQTQTGLSAFL